MNYITQYCLPEIPDSKEVVQTMLYLCENGINSKEM